ncbi:tectonin beta-propeller repeat-containing protein 2-like [Bolinopsis microptera]|uniref:tectonin beta-propeller repeat-containing protein 2-like n=1 Tax=Bolinopsis microptera TaxID=2820187 RepID=UPI00307A19F2
MRRRTLDVKQVCTSAEGGVWLLSNYNTLHRRYGIITGHNWANISRTLISGRREQWQTLAGEGAYPDISGPVWGLTMAGDIVCFTRSSPPRPLEPPCSQGRVVHIAATTNVLWAVDQSGQIHVREGLARDDVLGTHWQTLNMTQLMGVLLHKLSCSDRGVWAVDTTGTPWFRTGCYAGKDIVQAWVRVESNSLKFREVSSAGSLVWGVDGRNSVYVRTGVSYSLPVGSDWEQVPGLQCLHVRAAHEGVVALSTSQHLVYRYGACPTLPAGNYWRKVPGPPPDGSVSLITTLKGGGVWCQSGRSNLLV